MIELLATFVALISGEPPNAWDLFRSLSLSRAYPSKPVGKDGATQDALARKRETN
jgi:hypothetical protein